MLGTHNNESIIGFFSGISQSYVECICPSGYVGSGVGPSGCMPGGSVNSCDGIHCVNGACVINFAGLPICACHSGYTGMYLSEVTSMAVPQ